MHAQVNGTELYYHTHGEGPAMLVMHGGLGLDHTYFLPWLNDLSGQVELIYYDHRGNGRSQRPNTFEGITHETWANDANALRQHLGHEQIILFGHSYGSFLAQEYATRFPDTLAGLILCAAAPAIDYMDIVQANAGARGKPAELEALGRAFGGPTADDADFQDIWTNILPLYFKSYDANIAAAIDKSTQYSGNAWNHVNANCLPAFNVLEQLSQVNVPTLIITGADDWITPPKQGGQRIHDRLPNSEYVIFEESGHFPHIEESNKFIKTVSDWLSKL